MAQNGRCGSGLIRRGPRSVALYLSKGNGCDEGHFASLQNTIIIAIEACIFKTGLWRAPRNSLWSLLASHDLYMKHLWPIWNPFHDSCNPCVTTLFLICNPSWDSCVISVRSLHMWLRPTQCYCRIEAISESFFQFCWFLKRILSSSFMLKM